MNHRESYQMPRQSFPMDVTSPAPTQLPGPQPDLGTRDISPKPVRPDYAGDRDQEEDKRAAASYL